MPGHVPASHPGLNPDRAAGPVAARCVTLAVVAARVELSGGRGRLMSREPLVANEADAVGSALVLATAAPIVAVHAWSGGRTGGRQAGALATAFVAVAGAGSGHRGGWEALGGGAAAVATVSSGSSAMPGHGDAHRPRRSVGAETVSAC